MASKPSPLFPGPELQPRDDIPNLKKVKKPSVLAMVAKQGTALPSYVNKAILPIAGQEPLTELQRTAEIYEFSAILQKVLQTSAY